MGNPNNYIVQKDAEWVRRWEEREQQFRKQVEDNRSEYDKRIKKAQEDSQRFNKQLYEQQRVILKIRDELPIIGKWIVRWAGYND